jgi:hypothetical protein
MQSCEEDLDSYCQFSPRQVRTDAMIDLFKSLVYAS